MLTLDMIQTVAFAGMILFVGYWICRAVPVLNRYNIPAAVVGGLLVALANLGAHLCNVELFQFDMTLRDPLMIAFFTSIGFGASVSLLRLGGSQVAVFFVLATICAVGQNLLGAGIASAFGLHPLFGVLSGSVTLTGGPATGQAFAKEFQDAGVNGAATVALVAAMVGIISGGLMGGPIGTLLIDRFQLKTPLTDSTPATPPAEGTLAGEILISSEVESSDEILFLKTVVVILVAMALGAWLSAGFRAAGLTLPAYIGAMLVASVIRNFNDVTKWIGLSEQTIENLGNIALSLSLVLFLMTLQLWELAGLALPLAMILVGQVLFIAVVCLWPIFPLMGRDYQAAVTSAGFCGFMLGTTANSMVNMKALTARYGPAPRPFLVVPIVGAFLIDFTNALIITGFLNFWK